MRATRCILHATDFSPAARPAFEYALASAQRDGAALVLAHVIEPPATVTAETFMGWSSAAQEAAEIAARAGFDPLLARAKEAGVTARDVLLFGRPPEEIVKAASAEAADIIVMGTHGRTGLRRLVLGSVAQQVITMAPCPVVTVRMT